jgi:hypothetical protein
MIEMKTVRRVTVYADGDLESTLVEHFLSLGSNGYTVIPCRGKGQHGVIEDPFGSPSHVRIELLVQPAAAQKIVAYLQSGQFNRHAVAVCVEHVEVPATEQF